MGDLADRFQRSYPKGSDQAKNTILGGMLYGDDHADVSGKKEDDSKILDHRLPLSRDELLDNMIIMAYAGHDTTYCTLSNVLYQLSKHPSVLQHLTNEITGLKEPIDYEELKDGDTTATPILNAVLYETMRLYPVASFVPCKALTTLKFHHKGTTRTYTIPKNMGISMGYSTGKSKENFWHPSDFAIARFLPQGTFNMTRRGNPRSIPVKEGQIFPSLEEDHICVWANILP